MFLKKNTKNLSQLNNQQKIKYLQKVTKVCLNNLKTNIIESDLEQDQNFHYPLSIDNSIFQKSKIINKQKQIRSKTSSQQRKQKIISLEQKLNKTIKSLTKQLYEQEKKIIKSENLQHFNHLQFKINAIQEKDDCLELLNSYKKIIQNQLNHNEIQKQQLYLQAKNSQGKKAKQEDIKTQSVFNIKFIPTSKIIKRNSQPLTQITNISNIFCQNSIQYSKFFIQERENQKYNQPIKTKKLQKFSRSNRKSINQQIINKQNIDKKQYSIKKQGRNIQGWITKRETKQIHQPQIYSKKELQINKNQQSKANKMRLQIKNHKLFGKLSKCENLSQVKDFCQMLLIWYDFSQTFFKNIDQSNEKSKAISKKYCQNRLTQREVYRQDAKNNQG